MAAGAVEVDIVTPNARAGAIFDGVDDKVTFTATTFDLLAEGTTFSFWIKRNLLLGTGKILGNTGFCCWSFLEFFGANSLRIETDTNADYSSSIVLSDRKWHHVVIAATGGVLTWYLDGVDQSVADPNVTDDLTVNNFGTNNNGVFFNGVLSDFRIYKGAITAAEVTQLFSGDTNINSELINNWKFKDDYNDSAGNLNGTNVGTRFGMMDDAIMTAIEATRVTANDKHLFTLTAKGLQVIHVDVEEAK